MILALASFPFDNLTKQQVIALGSCRNALVSAQSCVRALVFLLHELQ